MISPLQRAFRRLTLVVIIVTACSPMLGQAQWPLIEVESTPYDHQMCRVEPTLTGPSGCTFEDLTLTLVNEWMIELRAMPYRYSKEWHTPIEVQIARAADCKGKAIALYDKMQLNGAINLRLVIGKRRSSDLATHAWVEWQPRDIAYILDPTFNWVATIKGVDRSHYVPFYAYEGAHKYLASDPILISKNLGVRAPIAPSQGTITRPVRSTARFRSDQTNTNEVSFELRMLASRGF